MLVSASYPVSSLYAPFSVCENFGFHIDPQGERVFQPILVFDSGIGGLSVLQEIRNLLPCRDYVYLFDNARLPYGELPEAELISGCVDLVTALAAQVNAALVVIACNTASTVVLPALRRKLSIPVVGVVPAIKPAAALSKSQEIGLLATPGTIKRDYTRQLIQNFATGCQVHLFGSSELVMLAEHKAAGGDIDMQYLDTILSPIKQTHLDVLVLGCTHFPMLKAELTACLGKDIRLLDSGLAVAKRVNSLLTGTYSIQNKTGHIEGFYTKPELAKGLQDMLSSLGFSALGYLPPRAC